MTEAITHKHNWEKIEWDANLKEWIEDFWPPMIEGEFRCRCGMGALIILERKVVSVSMPDCSESIKELPYGNGEATIIK